MIRFSEDLASGSEISDFTWAALAVRLWWYLANYAAAIVASVSCVASGLALFGQSFLGLVVWPIVSIASILTLMKAPNGRNP